MIKEKGFTLLEVVIAVGILVMVGGVAVAASIRAVNVETYSKDRTRAQDLARDQIEFLRVIRDSDYQDKSPGTVWNSGVDACLGRNGFINDNGGQVHFVNPCSSKEIKFTDSPPYQIKVLVQKVADDFNGETDYVNENKNLRRVTVTVVWNEPFLAGEQNVVIKTYLSNDKIGS